MAIDAGGHGWPTDPQLSHLVGQALEAARTIDPLTMALVGEPVGLPLAGRDQELVELARMERVAGELEALGQLSGRADEFDRVALIFGLRRATAAGMVGGPLGSRVLERHLLSRLSQLALGIPGAIESLRGLTAAGPGILARSRDEAGHAGAPGGHLALEAARRLPALLDACAGAVGALAIAVEVRFEVEAALGRLLQAAAEDSGWLLKEYLPAAATEVPRALPDPLWAGLGFSLEELEAEAEGALAAAVGDLSDGAPATALPDPGPPATTEQAAREWRAAGERCNQRYGLMDVDEVELREAPSWLRGLLPPLGLIVPGPGAGSPVVLVANQGQATLLESLDDLYLRDYVPAAAARANFRVARALLPAPELAEGWRAFTATGARGAGELAWRAALALAAISMARGRAGAEQAAELISAESGLPADQARLQAMAVAERPMAALTFLAGRRLLLQGSSAHGERGVARWLGEGSLPGAALRELAGR